MHVIRTCMLYVHACLCTCVFYVHACDMYMYVIRTCMFYVHACERDRWVPFLMEKCLGRGLDLPQ